MATTTSQSTPTTFPTNPVIGRPATWVNKGIDGIDISLHMPETSRLLGIRRGLEKESLRAQPSGMLALTPHPAALGSPLTHPGITTDFSESQVELVTGTHASAEAALSELTQLHQTTLQALQADGDEMLWVSSMPCGLPTDETIPIARFGSSNVGRAKSIYRMGLGHRYGRRMQTISGIHYNWSMPGLDNEDYFSLIRNFRRHAFLLLVLFGASPAVCSTFVEGRDHALLPLIDPASANTSAKPDNAPCSGTMYMPYSTSLRMGRLGYQSDAQATLAVSYNSLEGYAASLHAALTQPYPSYEQVGIQNPGGDYNQLACSLLQIENEFYGTIRPKRVIYPGERPLHALRERGVEYIEVRLMDLDPFEPVGIAASTMRLLDIFLLHCLLAESPPDSPEEIADIKHNQHLCAARGREPGLQLKRQGTEIALTDWGLELLQACEPIAQALDAAHGGLLHAQALAAALSALKNPETLPSARVLAAVRQQHGHSFVQFILNQSEKTHAHLLALPFSPAEQAHYEKLRADSIQAQAKLELQDSLPFEIYRQQYVSEHRLGHPAAPMVRAITASTGAASAPVAVAHANSLSTPVH